jgi:TorA maturation chaperone TorD
MQMRLQEQIATLFLCADILEYPETRVNVKKFYEANGQKMARLPHTDEIEAEFIRIFLINATALRCVPYASWWIDKKMSGATLPQIDAFYRECGYEFDAKTMQKPADHVAFMVRFAAILAEERRFETLMRFSKFLGWTGELTKSLREASEIKLFADALDTASNLIYALKEQR